MGNMTPMLKAETNAEFISAVAASPDVRTMTGVELSPALLERFMARPGNMVLSSGAGAFLIDRIDDETCEVHMLFRPRSNGAELMAACKEACGIVAQRYNRVFAFVPQGLRAVALIALRNGFKLVDGVVRQHPQAPQLTGRMYLLEF